LNGHELNSAGSGTAEGPTTAVEGVVVCSGLPEFLAEPGFARKHDRPRPVLALQALEQDTGDVVSHRLLTQLSAAAICDVDASLGRRSYFGRGDEVSTVLPVQEQIVVRRLCGTYVGVRLRQRLPWVMQSVRDQQDQCLFFKFFADGTLSKCRWPARSSKGSVVQTLYLVLMFGVAVLILAPMFEAIKAVSSKPIWEQTSQPGAFAERRAQSLPYVGVERRAQNLPYVGVERRTQNLPYVGVERRKAKVAKKVDVATTRTMVEQQRKVA